jgi:hypothetical protein
MNVKSIVVEQIDWNATSKSLSLEPDHNGQLWVAFPTDYDEPKESPFYFQNQNYDKKFNKGFAECKARKVSKNNFFEKDGLFTYKADWQNITTERNHTSYYALYLPKYAIPNEVQLIDPYSGRQYRRTVFKDEQKPRYIIYLQCASRFGRFSFKLICKFNKDKDGFSESGYSDEFQEEFYGNPEEWKYQLGESESKKVEQHFTTNNYQTMGDQYNINQAGAVGPNSIAKKNTFNQANYHLPENTNYDELASELEKLKKSLIEKATSPDHYTAISEVTKAEEASKLKDGNKVVKSLLTAGKWVFNTATDIGVNIVAEIINKQMGG